MTLFAGSTSSSNKIKINSIYPHSCSHSVIHAVMQSCMQSLTPNQLGRSFVLSRAVSTARAPAPARRSSREPERPTQKWIVLTHWINPRGHQTKALRSLRARNPRVVDSREQNGWLSWILCTTSLSFLSRTRGTVLDPFDHRRSLFTYFFFHVTGLLLRFVLTQRHENRGALLRRLTQRLKSVDVRRHGKASSVVATSAAKRFLGPSVRIEQHTRSAV